MFDDLLETKYELSIGKIILMFYLLISSSSLFPLLSKQWKKEINKSRILQHILGFITMLSLAILVSNGKFSNQRIFIYSIAGYLWFIMSTKIDLHWNIAIIILLIAFVLYQDMQKNKDKQMKHDKNITEYEKDEITKNNKKNYFNITIILILLTLGGTLLYSQKKEGQYGGGYSLFNYLLY